ncbi:MAG TPA: hypothetical protein VK213_02695 [Bacteroidales bacterium]|nr:hypothetical protein [Bacteroidales bacterium]
MNKDDRFHDDRLREFIDPLKIEKAPEGFSPKLMSMIYLESPDVRKERKTPVPYISGIIIVVFTAAAFMLPESSFPISLFGRPLNFHIQLPELKFSFEMPDLIIPVLTGIVLLVIFDIVLKGLFNRRKLQD